MDDIKVFVTPHMSDLYRRAISLRYNILRKPLGLHFTREQFENETDEVHIIAQKDNIIVGCLILVPFENNRCRMRQVAVAKDMQGLGIGKKLVLFSEQEAKQRGWSEIFMHARIAALEFYLKLGYLTRGEKFREVGIPHLEMYKIL